MCETHNHFRAPCSAALRTIRTTRMDEPTSPALCLGTSVPKHKPHKKLGNEANPFSQQAIPFLPLTRHAAKQTASYLNSAVETAGDAEKIYPEDRYILTFCLSLGHRSRYLSVCPWVISYTSYLSQGSKQVISVPGSKGILVCLSYGGVGEDLANRGCILIYWNSPMRLVLTPTDGLLSPRASSMSYYALQNIVHQLFMHSYCLLHSFAQVYFDL